MFKINNFKIFETSQGTLTTLQKPLKTNQLIAHHYINALR